MTQLYLHKPSLARELWVAVVLIVALAWSAATGFAVDQYFGAKPPLQASVRGDGTLIVDGKPVFPIGIRTEKLDSFEGIGRIGFNLVLGSGEWGKEHYKSAAKRGLMVLAGFYEWATFASFRHGNGVDLTGEEYAAVEKLQLQARDQGRRTMQEALQEFDHAPAVIGWNTNEEPEAKLVELLEYAYEIFKSYNPKHIVVSLVSGDSTHWLHLYKRTCDVLVVDVYPLRGSSVKRGSIIESFVRVQQAVKAMQPKPVWLMSQAIPPSYFSRDSNEDLLIEDMRLHHYLGLIGGAKGVILYQWATLQETYDGGDVRPASDSTIQHRTQMLKQLVSELKQLGPIICEGRETDDLEFRWISPGKDGPGLQTVRELDVLGSKYVLVANPLDEPIEALAYGVNGGNRGGYTVSVFQGVDALAVKDVAGRGDGAFAAISIGSRGCGVFKFDRKSIIANPRQ